MSNNDNTVFVNFEKQSGDGQLDMLYMELGKAYYEGGFEDPLPELLPLFDQITAIVKRDQAPVLEPEPEAQSVSSCPGCGMILKGDERFCEMCGAKIVSEQAVQTDKYCLQCGKILPPNAAFCGECGAAVK
ncbi:MAG: zinc ribbon domain-containing protein [Lachnospiraceae bacterium]